MDLFSFGAYSTLLDKGGAIFGSCLVLATLGVLVGTSTVGVPVWEITVPPACIMLARDVWWDWSRHRSMQSDGHNVPPTTADAGTEVPDGERAPGSETNPLQLWNYGSAKSEDP